MRISDWSSDVCSSDLLAAVEALTLLGIAQDAVRLGDLLELLLDGLVARVDVRVQLLGQLAVGALDLVLRGRAVDVQQLVGILHGLAVDAPEPESTTREEIGRAHV